MVMKRVFYKKLAAFLAVLSIAGAETLSASDVVTSFSDRVSGANVTFSYKYNVKAKVRIEGSGSAMVQGNAFTMDGDGLQIWCDGKTRWTVDRAADEAVIESVDASSEQYDTNPALLVSSVKKAFETVSVTDGTFQGKSVKVALMRPKVESSVKSLKLFFSGQNLSGAAVTVKDGTVTEFVISDLKFGAQLPLMHFSFNEKSLDKSFIITDLR